MSLQWEISQTKHTVGLDTRAEKYVPGPTACHRQVSLSIQCCPVLPLLQLAWLPTSRDSVFAQHTTAHTLRGSGPAYREQLLLSQQLLPRPNWTKKSLPRAHISPVQTGPVRCEQHFAAHALAKRQGGQGQERAQHLCDMIN